jgi:hypothetical protein
VEEPFGWAKERFERAEASTKGSEEPFSRSNKGFTGAKEGFRVADEPYQQQKEGYGARNRVLGRMQGLNARPSNSVSKLRVSVKR